MALTNSIRFEESIRRIRQWWRNIRDEGDQNQAATSTATTTTLAEGPLIDAENAGDYVEPSHFSVTYGATPLTTPLFNSNSSPRSTIPAGAQGASTTAPLSSSLQAPPTNREHLSRSSIFPHGIVPPLDKSIRTKFGSKSELSLGHQRSSNCGIGVQRWAVMNQGYTSVSDGWHADGDGLDRVVNFPKPTKPSTHAEQGNIIRCASVLDMDFGL
jgi:hypothetical protein